MQTRSLEVTVTTAAPLAAVWALLANVETWSDWAAFDESVLERPGHKHPQGVGALRRFRSGRVKNTEEVVHFDPPYALGYEVRETTIPMRSYSAEVHLSNRPQGGTTIHWLSRFEAHWTLAPLIERRLRSFIGDTAERLATAASSNASTIDPSPAPAHLKPER